MRGCCCGGHACSPQQSIAYHSYIQINCSVKHGQLTFQIHFWLSCSSVKVSLVFAQRKLERNQSDYFWHFLSVTGAVLSVDTFTRVWRCRSMQTTPACLSVSQSIVQTPSHLDSDYHRVMALVSFVTTGWPERRQSLRKPRFSSARQCWERTHM
jgi:hypothetical protein